MVRPKNKAEMEVTIYQKIYFFLFSLKALLNDLILSGEFDFYKLYKSTDAKQSDSDQGNIRR